MPTLVVLLLSALPTATNGVVTADREILETARAHGSATMRVSEFLQIASRRQKRMREIRSAEKPEHLSAREIDEWRRLFEKPRDEE